MNFKQNMRCLIAGSALALASAGGIQAATVDFNGSPNGVTSPLVSDGFSFDVARIVNGNCAALDCLALNPEHGNSAADFVIMTLDAITPTAFNVTSVWLYLTGTQSNLVVTGYDAMGAILNTATYTSPGFPHNTGDTLNFAGLFDNVFSISFTNTGKGNVRVDDINASAVAAAAVPLPAAGGLLIAAMAGLGMFGRRRNKLA
ncbi:MAG: VPLPA-CTERM sorting domain-containing protein [Pseudomonadota bacterium]